jgi:STE24 endopeptidase
VPTRLRLPFAVASALVVAEAAALLLRPRDRPVPVDVAPRDYFSAGELETARRYQHGQRRLYVARAAVQLGVLGLLVRRPPRPLLGSRRAVATGAATAAALAVGLTAATLPITVLSRRRGRAVGLITQGWGGWAADVVKSTAIESILTAGGGALLVSGARRLGRRWWLPGAGVLVGFGALGSTIAPVLLDPLFNRFTALPEGSLRADVLALAERAGVRVGEVYDVDASRRTTAANAYVTGLGPTKRVVLFDTLVRDFTEAEVRLVIAHELGHQRFRDVTRALVFLGVVAPFGTLAVARLGERLTPAGEERGAALVPATALAAALLAPALTIASNRLSRAVEVRADRFAVELTGDAPSLVDFHRRIAVQNVADPDPPRWVRILMGTHPTTMERIGHALALERGSA